MIAMPTTTPRRAVDNKATGLLTLMLQQLLIYESVFQDVCQLRLVGLFVFMSSIDILFN